MFVDRSGGVLRVTLNAPERRNAVDTAQVNDLADLLADDADLRVAVVAGSGGAFCAGARLSAAGPNPGFLSAARRLITTMTSSPYPIVAAVDGAVAGFGCSLALAADITVASGRSTFLQAFVKVGLMPDGGANELLAASVGRTRALQLAMSGEKLSAEDAYRMGLISKCVPDHEFESAVGQTVDLLAHGPTLALSNMKAAINGASLPNLNRTLDFEDAEQARLLASQDYKEGVAAFREKRQPRFEGL
ncbi:enoyl-CoA hydratase-related protein [Rhodococcus sp. IEGM 1366]|uniref:enoyl-CoA hydratase/isomerase family protein n=1 Tax=Rhodococcus sp. IEGM 1366 TaxID=3082223 RepID=UPI002955842F|nr:enoyl-CoA hydratase-related protein [Rhodococcus sp. IEGM 1366]MDV8070975.1 enoyl-CoA hydratase-related protein [Rhodococcus sp. IEGM 1366]